MTHKLTPLIAGNWKMNGLVNELSQIETLCDALENQTTPECDVLICPPVTLLSQMSAMCSEVLTGAQDCHVGSSGAHTGDISAQMLSDAGASYIIVGHSERRADHHETDALVSAKAKSALNAGLVPIICVGETHAERLGALAIPVVEQQLNGSVPDLEGRQVIVIAYEPVWAIGTGLVPDENNIKTMHAAIRDWLINRFGDNGIAVRILYGGSLKPSNAKEILAIPHVNGGLIGGASLKADDLLGIINTIGA